jgi:hypothetical protein
MAGPEGDPGQPTPPRPEIEPASPRPEIDPAPAPEEAPPTPMPVQPGDDRPFA